MTFQEKLEGRWAEGKSVCVGLDPVYDRIPSCIARHSVYPGPIVRFNYRIIDATCDLAAAYKLNTAYYEAEGKRGGEALHLTLHYILEQAPGVVAILDYKRGDTGKSSHAYVRAAGLADAVTVNPYPGQLALQPFLEQKEKGIFVLCRMSGEGSTEFQELPVRAYIPERADWNDVELPLYEYVAYRVARRWNTHGNCGLVMGATHPESIKKVRAVDPDIPLLLPGAGTQRADVGEAVTAARHRFLVASSSAITYASDGPDFEEAARAETERLQAETAPTHTA